MSPDDTTTKRCTKCGETKPLDLFTKSKNSRDGLSTQCKACRAANRVKYREQEQERIRKYRIQHREAILEQRRQHRIDNRDARLEAARRYRAENHEKELERTRRWRRENHEELLDRVRKQYAENREVINEQKRRWRDANRETIREQARRRRKERPDMARANKHRRRARETGNGGVCTAADLAAIRAAQTDKRGRLICWKCGKPIKGTPHLDHWIPIKQGGPSAPGNLHFMHERCNKSKGSKLPSEIGRLI